MATQLLSRERGPLVLCPHPSCWPPREERGTIHAAIVGKKETLGSSQPSRSLPSSQAPTQGPAPTRSYSHRGGLLAPGPALHATPCRAMEREAGPGALRKPLAPRWLPHDPRHEHAIAGAARWTAA